MLSSLTSIASHGYKSQVPSAQDLFPLIPDLIWIKCNNSTISGSTIINSAVGSNVGNGTYWAQIYGALSYSSSRKTVAGSGSLGGYTGEPATASSVTLPIFTLPSQYTISFWYWNVNGSSSLASPFCLFVNGTGSHSNLCTYSNAAGNISLQGIPCNFINNSNSATLWKSTVSGQWNHFAYINTLTGTNNSSNGGSGKIYLNGSLLGTTTAFFGSGSNTVLGLISNNLNCNVYDVRMYSSVLSASDINDLYLATK
jgi:hypothetical protein